MTQKTVSLFVAALVVLGLDRFVKINAVTSLAVDERVPLLGELVSFTRVESVGAALGLFQTWSPNAQSMVFAGLSMICAGLVLSFHRGLAPRENGSAAALGAILAGVLSNAFDRFQSGVGIDFLHLGGVEVGHLPDFNVADVGIFLGVLTLIVELLATEMAARAQERPPRSRSTDNRH